MGIFDSKPKKVIEYEGKIIGTNFSAGTIDLLLKDGTVKSISIEDSGAFSRGGKSLELYRFLEDRRILIKGTGFDCIIKILNDVSLGDSE